MEYGDKMSSVLDITYKKPEAFEGAVSGSFLGASASVGHSTKRFSQLHGFRFKTNSTLLSTLDTEGEYKPLFFDYQTYLTYKINSRWDVAFLGNISMQQLQIYSAIADDPLRQHFFGCPVHGLFRRERAGYFSNLFRSVHRQLSAVGVHRFVVVGIGIYDSGAGYLRYYG